MKRIFLSIGAIIFAGAVIAGATGAFFSDVETSTGNTFTAGAIDLTVDSQQHYNNMVCVPNVSTEQNLTDYYWQPEPNFVPGPGHYPAAGTSCDGTWTATDLGAQKFFNFSDIKPGDNGENTISLHVSNNPAWACIDLVTTGNNENVAIEPETSAGDSATSTDGELAQNINFQTWLDDGAIDGWQNTPTTTADVTEGDNIWQVGENALSAGTLASLLNATTTITLADGGFGTALTPSVTNYVGMFWCAGTITGGAGNLGCDGASMGNLSQTDSAIANVVFRVEQERNNPNFRCVPQTAPTTGTVTLDKVVQFSDVQIAGVDVSDYTLHLVGPNKW
jgi:predicted ribosomally synthesized peptide with SipW-like signal peptide